MANVVILAKKYAKFLPLALAAVLSAIAGLVHPGMTPADWGHVVIIAAGALSVLVAPNVPGAKYVKETLAAITAVTTLAVIGITSGFTFQTDVQMVVAVLGAFGVAGLKNIGDYYHLVTNKDLNVVPAPEGPAELPAAPVEAVQPAPVAVTPAETPAPPAAVDGTTPQ